MAGYPRLSVFETPPWQETHKEHCIPLTQVSYGVSYVSILEKMAEVRLHFIMLFEQIIVIQIQIQKCK